MAIFFTVATISLIQHGDGSVLGFATMFSQQLIFGVTLGLGAGQGLVWTINRIRLPYDGLYPVFLLASVLLLYAGTSALGGSGFLAVYLAGLMLSKHDFIHKNSLLRFHDGLAWIMQIGIFLVLGLLVFPSQLLSVVLSGSILAFFLMFVARPISVFLSLAGARFSSKEKLMISWVGLRGATPIILATFPLMAGLPQADLLFNMVFFIVLISVIIQGMSIPTVAKWLDVAEPFKPDQRPIFEFSQNEAPDKRFEEFFIVEESALCDKAVVELGLPHGALIVMISRGNYHFVPRGDTLIHAADRLLMIFNREDEDTLRQFMAS
jgi:cell volume regulation protein A